MRRISTVLLAATALCGALLDPAAAADLAVRPRPVVAPPPFTWTGFYVGVNVGGAWADVRRHTDIVIVAPDPFTSDSHFAGVIGGGQVGYNWQTGPIVFGVEGDIQGSSQKQERSVICGVACTLTETDRIKWFATARGRLGYAVDRFLIYATGGAAWTNFSNHVDLALNGTTDNIFSASDTRLGWTVGGGVEWAWNGGSWKLEYLHIRTDERTFSTSLPVNGTITSNVRHDNNVVRVGWNYRF